MNKKCSTLLYSIIVLTIVCHNIIHPESHLYTVHAINATLETMSDQTKQHHYLQDLEQQCGLLKQQNQRQALQLEETKKELELAQLQLKQNVEEARKLKVISAQNTQLTKQLAELADEKITLSQQLAQANKTTLEQQSNLLMLNDALLKSHSGHEEMLYAYMNHDHVPRAMLSRRHITT